MIKFSRAGWNNVIIFAVMGFILLINATHENVFSSPTQAQKEQSVLGENTVILTLTINQQVKIERIGNTWRAIPANIAGQALEQMMMAWQQSAGMLIDAPAEFDHQLALMVSVELAGQPQALVLSIHATTEQLLIYNHQSEQWLALPMPVYSQLIPSQIFGE